MTDEILPDPAALVGSLRSFPYSAASAVADLVDNSIAAGATNVTIHARWNDGHPVVDIADDGHGMDRARLMEALRFAGSGPEASRRPSDLGRFGLGLKTASLSQCRRVIVTTRKNGEVSNLGWDIDQLARTKGWTPATSNSSSLAEQIVLLGNGDGTLIRWESLDRLLGADHTAVDSDTFDRAFVQVQDHLEMVFHRFLAGSTGTNLRISINGRVLEAWDPFLERYPVPGQVWKLEKEQIDLPNGLSRLLGVVLPTEKEARADGHHDLWVAAGRRNWNQLQGFYVYRLDRLITAGGYLGIGRVADEHTKLARIMVELDNTTDSDWLLDVTKSNVTPPPRAIPQLERVARTVCSRASNRYRHRIRTFCKTCNRRPCICPKPRQFELVWLGPNLVDESGMFEINKKHSLIQAFGNSLNPEQRGLFLRVLRMISKTLPIAFIRGIPSGEEATFVDRFTHDSESAELVGELLRAAFEFRLANGESLAEIRASLLLVEPFSDYPDLVDKLVQQSEQSWPTDSTRSGGTHE